MGEKTNSKFSFYDKDAPAFTQSRFLPPSKVISAKVKDCVIGDGCTITGATLENSVIGLRSIVNSGTVVQDSLLMGADFYESYNECAVLPDCTPVGIGSNCVIKKAIVDKNCR